MDTEQTIIAIRSTMVKSRDNWAAVYNLGDTRFFVLMENV